MPAKTRTASGLQRRPPAPRHKTISLFRENIRNWTEESPRRSGSPAAL